MRTRGVCCTRIYPHLASALTAQPAQHWHITLAQPLAPSCCVHLTLPQVDAKMQAERTRVDELPVLEAAGGVASDGGTWARVVDGVLEEKDCASLIASVNTKGTSPMTSSRVEWRTVSTAAARMRCSTMESMVQPAYPLGAATLLHIAGLANPRCKSIIII